MLFPGGSDKLRVAPVLLGHFKGVNGVCSLLLLLTLCHSDVKVVGRGGVALDGHGFVVELPRLSFRALRHQPLLPVADLIEYFVLLQLVHVFELAHENVAELVHLFLLDSTRLFKHFLKLLLVATLQLFGLENGRYSLLLIHIEVHIGQLVHTVLSVQREANLGHVHFDLVDGTRYFTLRVHDLLEDLLLVGLERHDLLLSLDSGGFHHGLEAPRELLPVLQLDGHYLICLSHCVDSLVNLFHLLVHRFQHVFLTLLQARQRNQLIDLVLGSGFIVIDDILCFSHDFLEEEETLVECEDFLAEGLHDVNDLFTQLRGEAEVLSLRADRLDERVELPFGWALPGGHRSRRGG